MPSNPAIADTDKFATYQKCKIIGISVSPELDRTMQPAGANCFLQRVESNFLYLCWLLGDQSLNCYLYRSISGEHGTCAIWCKVNSTFTIQMPKPLS